MEKITHTGNEEKKKMRPLGDKHDDLQRRKKNNTEPAQWFSSQASSYWFPRIRLDFNDE